MPPIRRQKHPSQHVAVGVGIQGPFRAQSLVKLVHPETNASYEVRVLRQDSIRNIHRMCCLKNKPYCQGLACKFLPNLAKKLWKGWVNLVISVRDIKRMRCSLNSPELQNEGVNLRLQGCSFNVNCFEK